MGVSAGMSLSLMMKHQNKPDETSVLLTVIEQYAKATVSLSDDFTSYLLNKCSISGRSGSLTVPRGHNLLLV